MNNEYFLFIWLDFSNWFSHIFVHLGSLWSQQLRHLETGLLNGGGGVPARRTRLPGSSADWAGPVQDHTI